MRKPSASLFLAAALFTTILFAGACDDINKPVEKKFVPSVPPSEKGRFTGPEAVEDEFSKQKMEMLYVYIFSTRESIREMGFKAIEAKGVDTEAFIKGRAEYSSQHGVWRRMIRVRKLRFDLKDKEFPPDHPGPPLGHALRLLENELDNIYREIYDFKPYDPEVDKRLLKSLNKARELLDKFEE
jgi:hypothetical protein